LESRVVAAIVTEMTTIRPVFVIGLDLGQAGEYTALAAVEKRWYVESPTRNRFAMHAIRHLERFPLGTRYAAIATAIRRLTDTSPLRGARLPVDETGVGQAVVDVFREAKLPCKLSAVTITAGNNSEHGNHVPKKELVGTLQVLLQSGRIKV